MLKRKKHVSGWMDCPRYYHLKLLSQIFTGRKMGRTIRILVGNDIPGFILFLVECQRKSGERFAAGHIQE